MSVDVIGASLNVPRETLKKLVALQALVQKWSETINLVARSSLPDLWRRHIEDSAFIARTAPGKTSWLDIGSGAGFPGLVVAIIYDGQRHVTLVESDWRKSEFLKTVRRELTIDVEILNERIENVPPRCAGIVSARALAPLPRLLELCMKHSEPTTTLVLPKGRNWQQEVLASRRIWRYDLDVVINPVSKDGVVLRVSNLIRTPHEA